MALVDNSNIRKCNSWSSGRENIYCVLSQYLFTRVSLVQQRTELCVMYRRRYDHTFSTS